MLKNALVNKLKNYQKNPFLNCKYQNIQRFVSEVSFSNRIESTTELAVTTQPALSLHRHHEMICNG